MKINNHNVNTDKYSTLLILTKTASRPYVTVIIIFSRFIQNLLKNKFKISFSNMDVRKFSKNFRKIISKRIFLNARIWLRFAQPRSVRH